MIMTLLDQVVISSYQGILGYWVLTAGGYVFVPLTESEIASLTPRTLFYTPAQVTGQIMSYKVRVSGTDYSWGVETQVGKEFYVIAVAKYAAALPQHTRMYTTITKPSGTQISNYDDDVYPYVGPNTEMTFTIRRTAVDAFQIDEAGTWTAVLSYVWIH
jgi:hypothetical protein